MNEVSSGQETKGGACDRVGGEALVSHWGGSAGQWGVQAQSCVPARTKGLGPTPGPLLDMGSALRWVIRLDPKPLCQVCW